MTYYITLTYYSPFGPYYAARLCSGELLKMQDGQPMVAWDRNLLRLWIADVFGYKEAE